MPEDSDSDDEGRPAFDHERRGAIYEALRQVPGMNLSQLHRATGIGLGVLRHHLGVLQNRGLVVRHNGERDDEVLFFADEDTALWDLEEGRALFGHPSRRRVALYVHAHPGCSAGAIGEGVGLDPDTVRHHLDALQTRVLVTVSREKRPKGFAPTDPMDAWVEAMGNRLTELGEED